jgi:guanosine-3',5'-bis(diphosphate) 3'-pyrophosphohydrolase
MVNYAKCCRPIPGDAVTGFISSERGMVVHREGCHNLVELRENTDKLVPLRWDEQVEGEFSVALRIELENRRGIIAVLATRINSMDVNIEKISSEDKDYQFSYVDLEMSVKNRVHLANIMKRIRSLKQVHRVSRVRH